MSKTYKAKTKLTASVKFDDAGECWVELLYGDGGMSFQARSHSTLAVLDVLTAIGLDEAARRIARFDAEQQLAAIDDENALLFDGRYHVFPKGTWEDEAAELETA